MLDDINSWVAIPLQLIGFTFAIWQINKARQQSSKAANAAERARQATAGTERALAKNRFIVLLQHLEQAESDLEWAVAREDPAIVSRQLALWRSQAGQLQWHIGTFFGNDHEMVEGIRRSIRAAGDARLSLQRPEIDLAQSMTEAQQCIAEVTAHLGAIMARISSDGGYEVSPRDFEISGTELSANGEAM